MMKEKGIARTDRAPEDYRLPYEDTDALIARGLIKVILPKDAPEGADTVKADISDMIGSREIAEKTPEDIEPDVKVTVESIQKEQGVPEGTDPMAAYSEPYRIGIEHAIAPETLDLSAVEVGDIAFEHAIDLAMIEGLEREFYAVKVSETPYVGRSLTKVRIDRIPAPIRKRLRPRVKNLVFTDMKAEVGLFVPYTEAEYLAMPRRERKSVFRTALTVQEYNRSVACLALLHHLGDGRFFEQLAYYEMHCRELAEMLPTAPEWGKWIKEL